MEEIIRIAAKTLTAIETILYNNTNGAIIKTIALNNTNSTNVEATLIIDGVAFFVPLGAKETKFLNSAMVVNNLTATGDKVNIHISGIQLGGE